MSTIDAVIWTFIAVVVAVIAERVIAHMTRRMSEETNRAQLAAEALVSQREILDDLLARPSVAFCMKQFLVDVADLLTDRRAAHALLAALSNGQAPEEDEESAELDAAIEKLRTNDAFAYDLYHTFVFSAPIAAFLQWPETAKAMAKLSLRLAREREPAAARDLVMMRHAVLAHV